LGGQGGDLIVSFPYKEGEIDKVSYTLENELLNIVVKEGPLGLNFSQKDVKFSEPDGIGWIHAVRLDNIHLIGGGSDYIKIICEERQKPGRAILITNEKLIEDVKNNSILYIGKTENDAMSLVYAYDMKKFPLEKNVCGN